MLPNWQLLNIVNTQENVILAVNIIRVNFLLKKGVSNYYY